MLTPADIGQIVLTALVCTTLCALLALLALRLNRRGTLASQFAIVVVAAIAAIVGSAAAIAAQMYLSTHDLTVLLAALGIAALLILLATALVGRFARRSLAALRESARRLGDGEPVDPAAGGWSEFADLSAQLADTSERLAAARMELERVDATRRRFFAWASHDLRTPLAGIAALAEALEAGAAEDPADYLRRIGVQTRAMNRLVDDLFELSRIDSGTLRLRRETIELRDLVSDAVADVRHLAEPRDVTVVYESAEPLQLDADPRELVRVVVNLLANAIRHAPPGSPVVVSARALPDGRVELAVTDRGSGVPEEDLGHVFEVGWRAESARTADEDGHGAGIGLAIVRGIAEAHGGAAWAERLAGGFRVGVVLPAL